MDMDKIIKRRHQIRRALANLTEEERLAVLNDTKLTEWESLKLNDLAEADGPWGTDCRQYSEECKQTEEARKDGKV